MRLASLLAACSLVLAARTVHADDEKSPGAALALSAGATVGGVLLMGALAGDSEATPSQLIPAAALALTGPSWGHIYTGDYDLAIGGTLLRVIGLAMIAEGQGDCDPNAVMETLDSPCERTGGTPGLVVAGGLLLAGTALAEIIDAPLAARRHNRELELGVAPVVTKDQYGVTLVGRF